MSLFPEALINGVREALTGEAVLRLIDYRTETIQEGPERIKCFCPIHHETIFRTLVIEKEERTYRCGNYSCDGAVGGDLIDLFARARGISREQAVLSAASALGLEIDASVIESYLETTIEVARNYLDLGALAEAEEHLTGLVSIRPDCIPALEALASVYERQKRQGPLLETLLQLARTFAKERAFDKALETLEACRKLDAGDPAVAAETIRTLKLAGRLEEAARQTLALADRLAGQGETGRALEHYRAVQEMGVDGIDAWGPMTKLLLAAGRTEEAIAELLRQSDFELNTGDSEAAFDALERAVELSPSREDLIIREAELTAAGKLTGRPLERVCRHVERLLGARAHGAAGRVLEVLEDAFADVARVLCLRADLAEAAGDAERALDLRLGLVERLERDREFDAALDALERILEARPSNIALMSRKANLLRAMGRIGEAIPVYLEIVDLFVKSDELANAAGIYQTIIDLAPEEPEHRGRQLEIYLKLGPEPVIVEKALQAAAWRTERGQTAEGLRLLERALEKVPHSCELLLKSGGLYEQSGRRGEAAERFLEAGRLHARSAQPAEAQEAFERALRLVPEHLEAREALAGALVQSGQTLQAIGIYGDLAGFYLRERDPAAAIRLCLSALDAAPDHLPTLARLSEAYAASDDGEQSDEAAMRIADLHIRAEDWGKATAICETVLARREDSAAALERLAAIAEATRQGENSISCLWQLAQAHRRAGRQADELAALERLLKTAPMHLGAWQRQMELQMMRATPRALAAAVAALCEHFEKAGKSDDAIELLETLGRGAENPKPEIFAGLAKLGQTRGDAALRRRALRIQAELLGRLMRDAEALDVWEALAAEEPENHAVLRMRIELMKRNEMTGELVEEYRRLSKALAATGHDQQAIAALLEVIALRPRDLAAREELIDLMIRRGDRVGARQQIEETTTRMLEEDHAARAIALQERILGFDPDDPPTYRKIIGIYQRMEDLTAAAEVYERLLDVLETHPEGYEFEQAAHEALRLAPDNEPIRRRLAEFYARDGRPAEAESLLLALAVGQIEDGALAAAEESLERLLKINPTSVPGRAHRAELMVRLGKTEDALVEFMSLTGQLTAHDGLQSLVPQTMDGNGHMRSSPGGNYQTRQYEGIPLIKDYTFGNFIVGERNNFAHAAAMAACRAPGKNYNPLFLFSDVGLGKTHLCHAIAHHVATHFPEMKVRYITMEEFVTGLIDAIGGNSIAAFRSWHKVIDVLIMDDVQFLSGKERAQEEFFHVFNALFQAGKQVVLTSDRPPKDIEHLEKRLKSRFGAGIIVDIQPPDLETRVAILRHELNVRGCKGAASEDVLMYIAEHVESNVRELKGALNQVLVRHEISGETLDLVSARKVLSQTLANA